MKKTLFLLLGAVPALAVAAQTADKAEPKPKAAAEKAAPAKPAPAKPATTKPAPPPAAKPAPAVPPAAAAAAAAAPAAAGTPAAPPSPATPAPPPVPLAASGVAPDLDILHAQVILDRLGFAPGVIDGRKGRSLTLALKGFQTATGLESSGTLDPKTLAALAEHTDIRPLEVLTLGAPDLMGQFVGPLPHDYALQAALPCLCYANPLEMLAERYHTTPATLAALNPGAKLVVGQQLKVPAIGTADHAYPAGTPGHFQATLIGLNVAAKQIKADHIVVSKAAGSLSVYDFANKLIAQFPVTTGSEHDPLPIGDWKVQGAAFDPQFHYNPKLFWDAKKGDKRATLPPGPNGPVGVVWLDLSKEHYGIHGTPNPEKIGRSESHGCIRMANWDVARLALMVKPGTPAVFQP